jgi:hypothetical protein
MYPHHRFIIIDLFDYNRETESYVKKTLYIESSGVV